MQTKKWLLGASAILGIYAIPVSAEPNEMEQYYQSLIEVGYYYAEISISKSQCFSNCLVNKTVKEGGIQQDSKQPLKLQDTSKVAKSSKNSQKTNFKNSKNVSNSLQSSNKATNKTLKTDDSTKTNTKNATTSTVKEPVNANDINSNFSTDNQEDIKVRNINKPNEIDANNSTLISKEGFHFVVYKEWQANKSNVFIKQVANINNKETTISKAFYSLAKNDFYYKQTYNSSYPENDNFAKTFPFYNLAYADFMYYLYHFKKIKENDTDVFFNATLKKTDLIADYPLLLSPSIRVKFSKKYNIPIKFVFFNKANKAVGEVSITEVDQIGKRFYAVAYSMVNSNHEQSSVSIDNILIGLSLDVESDSKLHLDEYKDLTKETIIYEVN